MTFLKDHYPDKAQPFIGDRFRPRLTAAELRTLKTFTYEGDTVCEPLSRLLHRVALEWDALPYVPYRENCGKRQKYIHVTPTLQARDIIGRLWTEDSPTRTCDYFFLLAPKLKRVRPIQDSLDLYKAINNFRQSEVELVTIFTRLHHRASEKKIRELLGVLLERDDVQFFCKRDDSTRCIVAGTDYTHLRIIAI